MIFHIKGVITSIVTHSCFRSSLLQWSSVVQLPHRVQVKLIVAYIMGHFRLGGIPSFLFLFCVYIYINLHFYVPPAVNGATYMHIYILSTHCLFVRGIG